ncbi:hypothetical protein RhiirA1_538621 [Rhizophagus irregularis]|uniref:Protein kinase domain-containing protein n=1 Tax=Rhizophagus irregularis TaxID=588596 RepID=A0A2N0R7H6_9GLOM|nr:hypothetical protein RhiirA1_540597 [Rhizophagus irregularis]PKC62275.1 hypothetical protein RhiirA1_538621 [Rhizophagus irregularis]
MTNFIIQSCINNNAIMNKFVSNGIRKIERNGLSPNGTSSKNTTKVGGKLPKKDISKHFLNELHRCYDSVFIVKYYVIPYVAPEIFQDAIFSKESDIYSLGMIMWELTTGFSSFNSSSTISNQVYTSEILKDKPFLNLQGLRLIKSSSGYISNDLDF